MVKCTNEEILSTAADVDSNGRLSSEEYRNFVVETLRVEALRHQGDRSIPSETGLLGAFSVGGGADANHMCLADRISAGSNFSVDQLKPADRAEIANVAIDLRRRVQQSIESDGFFDRLLARLKFSFEKERLDSDIDRARESCNTRSRF